MSEIVTRPMTQGERTRLAAFADEPRTRVDAWVVGLFAPFALLFVPYLVLQTAFPALADMQTPFLLFCLAAGAGLATILRRRRARGSAGTGPLVEADLRRGEVDVERLALARVAQVRREAGREPAVVVEVTGEGVVFLEGAYLREALEKGDLARETVEFARAPLSRHVLSVSGAGGRLELGEVAEPAAPAGEDGPYQDGDLVGEGWPGAEGRIPGPRL